MTVQDHSAIAELPDVVTLRDVDDLAGETSPFVESLPACPHLFWHPLRAAGWIMRTAFGIASLLLLLAVVAAIPILNFLVLGYLLHVMGETARTGKIRSAFPLLNQAPRLGSIALGFWICVFPLRLLANASADAHLIDPGSTADRVLQNLVLVASVLMVVHLCLALARGGSLSCFFRPIKNFRWFRSRWRSRDYLPDAAEYVTAFVGGLRLKYHFMLGLRGFVGAFLWLVLPTAIFASVDQPTGGEFFVSAIGWMGLVLVLCWLPFLTVRFAVEDRFSAMFELRAVRELYAKVPIWSALVIILTCVLALPMYLFKVVLPPQDAMWLETLIFLLTIWPVKFLTGWVYHRATLAERRRHFLIRWPFKLATMGVVGAYVAILFFTQFIGEHGKSVLFEHHAFLLPIPF